IFKTFPPVFLCLGDSSTIDQSATDADGDSLVYSLATPYDGEYDTGCPGDGGPYVGIPWLAPYSETNQITGTLEIDSFTGVMTVVPALSATDSDYVVGVKVQEYRNDSLINTNIKDFQFHVITCLADFYPAAPASNYTCGGPLTVKFHNDSTDTTGATVFWDFGDLTVITDTSSLDTAIYIYPDTGSYTVTLITNPGVVCADTATLTIFTAAFAVGFDIADTVCITGGVAFTDTSVISPSMAIVSWAWDFGDVSTSTAQSPTHAYADSGTYDVKLVVTTDSGCVDSVTKEIYVQKQPTAFAGGGQTVCGNNAVVTLAGTRTIATGSVWTTGGSGVFADSSVLTTTYTPSSADTAAGSVTLTLTTTGNGFCVLATDAMTVTITDAPKVQTASDTSICADVDSVAVSGAVTVATGGSWTSDGSGTFGAAGNLATAYYPSDADTADGFIILTLTSTGNGTCAAVADVLNLTITPEPTANAGSNQTVCGNNAVAVMAGSKTIATGVSWTTSGSGTFDNNTSLVAVYTPSTADTTAPGNAIITLTMTTTGNGSCGAAVSAMTLTITDAPIAYAGSNQSVCANNAVTTLAGSVKDATGGSWATLGGGSFGNPLILNTAYTPSAADIAAGTDTLVLTTTGNGTCLAVTDTMVITITPAPTSNAGGNQTVCANNNVVTLTGSSVTVATGGGWTTSGDGAFIDTSVLGTDYTPGPADIAAGTVTLTLTTTGNFTCSPVSSFMVVTIAPAPTVDAGPIQTVCANNRVVSTAGTSTLATSVLWTSTGTGAFTDNADPTTFYTPSDADTALGTDTLILTTTGPVGCVSEADTMILTITKAPKSIANNNQTVCASSPAITLAGTVYNSASQLWTVTFPAVPDGAFDNPTLLGAVYTPGAGDIAAGSVTFQLATKSNGPCVEATDAMTATINPLATASAGANANICSGSTYTMVGSFGGSASSITWTTSGTGAFTLATDPTTVYTPSAADVLAGTVTLTITTDDPDGAGPCAAAVDFMILTINPIATTAADVDATICEGSTHTMAGSFGGSATSITWTTSGTGAFTLATDPTTVYTPSAADILAGTVTLTITTDDPDGAGPCAAATDFMILTINLVATTSAGADATICAGSTQVMAGVFGGTASSITWTTSGTGAFTLDTDPTTVYTPSAADILAVTVTLTITTDDPAGPCGTETDFMVLTINPIVTVDAGPDATICSGSTHTMAGSFGGSASSITWTTSGSGAFTLATDPTTVYTPSAADILAGTVVLKITTDDPDGAGPCLATTDLMFLTINSIATTSAGADVTICEGSTNVMAGSFGGSASSITWTTSGTGA
ncbi:MAG TPA: PKD domain-containing protein, partial [Flavobacteriales bacterium]|nr:PKD domain-containing protein [Flavobacteriales bacterium]